MFDHPHTGAREFAVGGPIFRPLNPYLQGPSRAAEQRLMDGHLRDLAAQRDRAVERARTANDLAAARLDRANEAARRAEAAEEQVAELRAALLDARKACKRLREEGETHADRAERRLERLRRLNGELNEVRDTAHGLRRQLDAAHVQRATVAALPRINLTEWFQTAKPAIHPDAPQRPTRPGPTDEEVARNGKRAINEVWKAIATNAQSADPDAVTAAADLLTAIGSATADLAKATKK
ncbi:hypothetical protein [Prescottella equi]|uniref:hypothetical protein n=1 Tax=Rhodococcus hoagii TaxID=43767 RepID=UPI000D0E9959|nr:hypothetical protein [Prescottella equi]AVP71284.1 hypothetical protein C7H75_24695 [Prescottella equi]